jgi:putative permease
MDEDMAARREGREGAELAARAPVVVSQGLTYRDLQRAILLTFALIAVFHMAGPLSTLLLLFLLVFILAAVLNPVVLHLERRGVPRILSAIGIATLFLGGVALLFWLASGPLTHEIGQLRQRLEGKQLVGYYAQLTRSIPALEQILPPPDTAMQYLLRNSGALLGQVGRYTLNLAVGLLSVLLLLVLVVYTVAHPVPLVAGLLAATPERHRGRMEAALRRTLIQLQAWATGSLMLGVIVGCMCWLGLRLVGAPYALLFGVIAGVGELVPNIGPIVSAIPPVLVALTIDPRLALAVIAVFIVVQQLENNLIVPLVMGQSLNLHPISVTFAVLVMGALFGLLGAILAVPVCAMVKIFWEEFYLGPAQTDRASLEAVAGEIVAGAAPLPRPGRRPRGRRRPPDA